MAPAKQSEKYLGVPMLELIGAGGRKCVPVSELDYWRKRGFTVAPKPNPAKAAKPSKATAPPLPPPEKE